MASKVVGLDRVNRNLNRRLQQIGGPMTERFLTEVLIQGGTRAAEYTPVDTSNLINSQYRDIRRAQNGWLGELGYGAEYAVPVHEGPQKNWQKAAASNRFLEKGVDDMIRNDLETIIRRNFRL